MPEMLDLEPPVAQVTTLVAGVSDDQLGGPTPCAGTTVRGLLAHLQGLALAFRDAGEKAGSPAQEVPPGPAELDRDWRTLIPARLAALAATWAKPGAWEGDTRVAGMTFPAPAVAQVVVDELVIHGWDLARATRQPFSCDPASLQASLDFVTRAVEQSGLAGTEGMFGPVVEVPPDAPVIDRVIGLSGRDPSWTP